jgi:hypothetical protein
MQALYPGLKALFMSGYSGDAIASQGRLEKGFELIQKPFSISDFLEKIRRMLEG